MSPVNHRGLHQGWLSIHWQCMSGTYKHFHRSLTCVGVLARARCACLRNSSIMLCVSLWCFLSSSSIKAIFSDLCCSCSSSSVTWCCFWACGKQSRVTMDTKDSSSVTSCCFQARVNNSTELPSKPTTLPLPHCAVSRPAVNHRELPSQSRHRKLTHFQAQHVSVNSFTDYMFIQVNLWKIKQKPTSTKVWKIHFSVTTCKLDGTDVYNNTALQV